MSNWNPMLASDFEEGVVDYSEGFLFLPKLNGVRGGVQDGVLVSRQLKPIPNDYVRGLFSLPELSNIDGELVVGDFSDPNVFTNSTSGVMTVEGFPEVRLWCFDFYHPTMPFIDRIQKVHEILRGFYDERLVPVEYHWVTSDAEVEALGVSFVEAGYEGGVLRKASLTYKEGRSTLKEAGFMRWVPWHRSEAVILSIQEGKVNKNESVRNALGYLEKSSHKENKVGSGRAGSVSVRDLKTGIEFNMAIPGVELQKEVMAHPEKFLNQTLKYKFKSPVKVGGKPRFPQWSDVAWEGLRHPDDM